MVKIRALQIGPIATNCYIVENDGGEAVVIDPGCEYERILEKIAPLRVTHILLTHAHFDHIGGVEAIKRQTGALVVVHEIEANWLTDPELNLSRQSAEFAPWEVTGPRPDLTVGDREILELLSEKFEVLHTPGHSPGHVSYLLGDVVFGGDALFYGSVGRTDLPYGDPAALKRSIKEQLLSLPPDTTVLPGHGPPTLIGEEAKHNPFLRGS